ncbi:MAG: hypothetical protein OHK0022_30070 [Roseiflexaceae bacterium]
MVRIICPFCLKQHDVSGVCPDTGQQVPETFVKEYETVRPLWLVNVGFKEHGKTTQLLTTVMMLNRLSVVLDGFYPDPIDDHTLTTLRQWQAAIKLLRLPDATKEPSPDKPYRPFLLSLYNLPIYDSRCLVIYDVAGENYESLSKQAVPALQHCSTIWFVVSLDDLAKDDQVKTITELFKSYSSMMQRMKVDLRNRNLVVIYTKADKSPEHPEVINYLTSDPLKYLAEEGFSDEPLENFSLEQYMTKLQEMSDMLQNYTRTRVDGGSAFIAMVKAQGMKLHFCVTSALGQDGRRRGEHVYIDGAPRCLRVLDPLFWALKLDAQQGVRAFRLAVDPSDIEGYRYAQKLWEALTPLGGVMTFRLGQKAVFAGLGQCPPDEPPESNQPRLIGPLLEQAQPSDKLVVVVSRPIPDLLDFVDTSWRDRLLLVMPDGVATQGWPHTIAYSPTDPPSVVIDALLRI